MDWRCPRRFKTPIDGVESYLVPRVGRESWSAMALQSLDRHFHKKKSCERNGSRIAKIVLWPVVRLTRCNRSCVSVRIYCYYYHTIVQIRVTYGQNPTDSPNISFCFRHNARVEGQTAFFRANRRPAQQTRSRRKGESLRICHARSNLRCCLRCCILVLIMDAL